MQKEIAPKKAPTQTPVIESSIPNSRDKVIPAPAPAAHKGQCADTTPADVNNKIRIVNKKGINAISNF